MARLSNTQPLTLSTIHHFVGGELIGPPDAVITGLSGLENAGAGDLAYLASDRFLTAAGRSRAEALITSRHLRELATPQLIVDNPTYAFARVAQQFFVPPYQSRGIATDLARGEHVSIGQDVSIGFASHDAGGVSLYLQESIAFRVHSPEATVALVYSKKK